jgi:hypothetical protein
MSRLLDDPRHLQILCLGGLLAFGILSLGFDVSLSRVALLLAGVLIAQFGLGRAAGLPGYDPRSALVSGLSLCLLLRTPSPAVALLAATLTIGSKFVLRVGGKHFVNPTNFGIVATVWATGAAWVSPGQWGAPAVLGFLVVVSGAVVAHRALRSDVTAAFLAAYAGLLLLRALWLGDPLAIPLHQLGSGALLLFAFFMISDPRSTPDSRLGRVVFGVAVAALAVFLQFVRYRPVAVLPALFLLSPLVPLIDRLWPGARYAWPGGSNVHVSPKGVDHASLPVSGSAAPGALALVRPGVLRLLRRQGG